MPSPRLLTCLLLCALCLPVPVRAGEPLLRFAVGQAWAPPLVFFRDGAVDGGLLVELMQAIAREAGAQPSFVVLPPQRVDQALRTGQVDLHCLLSPHWLPTAPAAERWSVPLLQQEDVLLAAPGVPASGGLTTLPAGSTLGVVRDYRYPALDGLKQPLHLEVAPSQALVLDKLMRGRSDYAIVTRSSLDWYLKQHPRVAAPQLLMSLEKTDTHCLLAERTGLPAPRILAAVRRVVESGTLRKIEQRYR